MTVRVVLDLHAEGGGLLGPVDLLQVRVLLHLQVLLLALVRVDGLLLLGPYGWPCLGNGQGSDEHQTAGGTETHLVAEILEKLIK